MIIAILVTTALYFFAFSGKPLPKDEKGRVVVRYWEKWTGKEAEQMQIIVDDFNKTVGKQKGIYVEYLSMSDVNKKTLSATSAGVPPDIAGLWDGQVAQFAAINAVEPLDDLAAAHGITADTYLPVYWKACHYKGRLWALVSTPAAIALHYNKRIMLERGDKLRAAGLDPTRPPRTLDELDRYAAALDTYKTLPNGKRQIVSSGYLPMEPGWYLNYTGFWFGGSLYDENTGKFTLTSPEMVRALHWIASYSERMGKDAMTDFKSGFGQFNSAQNPFLVGSVVMEQQGPWMANYIEVNKPSMNHWHHPGPQDMSLSIEERRKNFEWGAAPFPSAVPGLNNVTLGAFDCLMIPKGAQHKNEAFEFLAYVNRQDVMEKLTSMHCKNSPLRQVSANFLRNHPNPYIDVFEKLAASPNAHGVPSVPIWPEVADELNVAVQKVYLLESTPEQALAESQLRLQAKLDDFNARQRARAGTP